MLRAIGYLYFSSNFASRSDIQYYLNEASHRALQDGYSLNCEVVRIDDNWNKQIPFIIKVNFRLGINSLSLEFNESIMDGIKKILCKCMPGYAMVPTYLEDVTIYEGNIRHDLDDSYVVRHDLPNSHINDFDSFQSPFISETGYRWDKLGYDEEMIVDKNNGRVTKIPPPPKIYVEKESTKRSVFILRELEE
jgi:hypothetical protein